MNENSKAHGVSLQGVTFRYTEHGTLLITLGGTLHKEFNPCEAADLLRYLDAYQGDLFTHAKEGDMATWPRMRHGVPGKSEMPRDILDSYEKKNAYSQGNDGIHHDGG